PCAAEKVPCSLASTRCRRLDIMDIGRTANQLVLPVGIPVAVPCTINIVGICRKFGDTVINECLLAHFEVLLCVEKVEPPRYFPDGRKNIGAKACWSCCSFFGRN